MARINKALSQASKENPVFYEDEVDINFNPKMGSDWYFKGQQKRIITPGKNQKYYLAGCFDIQTGKIFYTGYGRKNSQLFINMLEELKRHHHHAKTLTVILDNYSIHTSQLVKAWLEQNPTVTLLFLPVYSPWLNKIERLWQSLHETVTRNHCCQYMWQLIKRVKIFLNAASGQPGLMAKSRNKSKMIKTLNNRLWRRHCIFPANRSNRSKMKIAVNHSASLSVKNMMKVTLFLNHKIGAE
jgi:transposase